MKNFWIIVFILFFHEIVKAQDLIVRKNGDSLNCRLMKQDSAEVYFKMQIKESYFKTRLSKSHCSEIIPGYFADNNLMPKISARVGFHAGLGHLIRENPADVSGSYLDYLKKPYNGFTFDMDIIKFIAGNFGLGIKYNRFHSESEGSVINSDFISGLIMGNLPVKKNKGALYSSIAIGLLAGTEASGSGGYYTLVNRGYNKGLNFEAGFDFNLTRYMTLSFSLSYFNGSVVTKTIKEILPPPNPSIRDPNNGPPTDPERKFNRMNYMVGLNLSIPYQKKD